MPPEWLTSLLKIAATAAVAAGAGGFGMRQWDEGAPLRAEHELAELRLEAAERSEIREACERSLAREQQLADQARAEVVHFVERCSALVEGRE